MKKRASRLFDALISRSLPPSTTFSRLRRLFTSSAHFHSADHPTNSNSNPSTSLSMDDFTFLRHSKPNDHDDNHHHRLNSNTTNEALLISNAITSSTQHHHQQELGLGLGFRDSGFLFSDETDKLMRQYRSKLSEGLVIEVLNLVQTPHLALRFFLWAGRQIGYTHTPPVYEALIRKCGLTPAGILLPDTFLRELETNTDDHDKRALSKVLNVFILKCCKNGMWNAALEEFRRLLSHGYKPSNSTYNALLLVFLRADRLESACLLHKEMSPLGYSMDHFTLGCFLHSLCKARRWKEALNIVHTPDTVLYTKMISGLCEASLFEQAMDFLHIMRSNSCLPNVVTYTTLIAACLRKLQLGRCKRLLSMMITEGFHPAASLFNSLVHAYCSTGDYSYAYKLLEKMSACGCNPGYVVYNILIGGICGTENLPTSDIMEIAEKAYQEMFDAGFVLNKVNIGNFVRCLCGVGKYDKAFNVVREMMTNGFIPDTRTYSNVIAFLCQAPKMENAYLLFQEMKINSVSPDVYTYTMLIDSFCKAGLYQQACILFGEMIRDGCDPNVVTFTALIHAHLKARKVVYANELFEKMLSFGCVPNIVTYTALIDGHCKAGDIEKACQIYSRMRGDRSITGVDMYFKEDECNLVEPNVFTYGALVDGLCKAHKVADARDLLDAMATVACEPNHVVYDALIDGFCKVGKLDEAQEVFAKMSERGYSPNVYTYSSLIDRLFKDKRLDLALKVLSKMLENSCPPNVVTYTEMIDGLCKSGKTDEAYKLLLMMEEKGCQPNVVTYTALIDGFGKAGKVDMSLMLFQRMGAKGCAPNFVTYRVLINHCCATGLLSDAYTLLEEMKHTYWPRHVTGYRKVIEGFNKEFIISLGLLDEIAKDGASPIIPAYRILIDSFYKAGNLEVAFDLHKEIITSLGVSAINRNMFHSMIRNMSSTYKVEKAFELYGDMVKQGEIPEISAFVDLISGLVKMNKLEEALQLSDSLCHMKIYWQPLVT